MADRALGKLLAKSKSIRRARKGSVDGSSSIASDDAHLSLSSLSQAPSTFGRFSQQFSSHFHSEGHEAHNPAADTAVDDTRFSSVIILAHEGKEEGESTSLVSYDSEETDLLDRSSTRPPVISNHPSQIGYLTTNSPLIQADYYQGSRPSEELSTTEPLGELDPSGSPNPAGLAPPTSRSSRRSPSPVGRIKGVFRSKKSLSNLSGKSDISSPERRPATADAARQLHDFHAGLDVADLEPPKRSLTTQPEIQTRNAIEGPKESKRTSGERVNRLSRTGSLDTVRTPPGTPPRGSDKGTPPVIVNTPPTPTNTTSPRFDALPKSNGAAEGRAISQRRGRAGSASLVPSKLSTISSTPLTPIESVAPTPTPNSQPSGFFTSMITAAQSAAQNLSNTITNTNIGPGHSKNKGLTSSPIQNESSSIEEKSRDEPSVETSSNTLMGSQEPAAKTIGMGDLSLSQFGIAEPVSRATTPTTAKFPEGLDSAGRSRAESAPVDSSPVKTSADAPWDDAQRPQSLYEPPAFGEKTPPTGSVFEEPSGIHRSGSIRSAIGGNRRNNRKRGSTNGTGGTGNTIGAALSAVNSSLAQPVSQGGAPKLTGFAVASKRRNRDFHALFKSVPDDDYLIEDYSCALQREILAHGRLYVSEGHLCFSSNILGWVTTLVMSFDEIVSVEKRSTALLFKNGLMISTLHAKHIFASFASRDSTYDLIVKIWKLGHPGLQSSLNGVRLDETGGDKTEKIDAEESAIGGSRSASVSASEEDEESDDGDDVYDEDEEEDDVQEHSPSAEAPLMESAIDVAVTRKPSGVVAANPAASEKPKDAPTAPPAGDFPGPATHAPTECGDAETHYKRVTGDDVVPAPLGKVYDMLFGPTSVSWMSKFLTVDQKCTDLQMEDKKGLGPDNRTRGFTYIKPLNASIGPKQTKCIITENIENIDLEKAVNVLVTTQNPDVPSGNIFSVKTKYCLTWAENNATRVQINCTVEWTGKSWLKGPIENGAYDGQGQYCKDLFVALKGAVSKRSATAGGGSKARKRGKKGKAAQAANVTSDNEGPSKTSAKKDWGIFEPLHGVLGPVMDIGAPILTGNVVYGLLVGLLVAAWFGFGRNRPAASSYGPGLGLYGYPDRLAAYEEMWRREESELWEWLEERVGMDRLQGGEPPRTRQRVVEPRTVEEKVREERMSEREIREAIRITEEKLEVLKSVVQSKTEE